MSEPKIIEAEDTCNTVNSICHSAEADMLGDKEQQEADMQLVMTDTLVQVQELVDELHAFHRVHVDDFNALSLPRHLGLWIKKFLSEEGLKQLPSRERQEARLRILEAIGLCLENARRVKFIDNYLMGWSELSSSEVDALYRRRLESRAAFESLSVDIPANASQKWESESCRLLANILLGAKSLPEALTIRHVPLSGQSQVAKAVAASCHLKELTIWMRELEDEALGELMGETIASHQSLLTLQIIVRHDHSRRGTSVGTESSGESRMGSVGRLFWAAFLGDVRNTSINCLVLTFDSGREPVMMDLQFVSRVLQVAHITQLQLEGLESIQSGDVRRFFSNVLDNGAPHLQSLLLQQSDRWMDLEGIDVRSFALLVELLKSNSMPALKHLSFDFKNMALEEKFDWRGLYASLSLRQMESVSVIGYVGFLQAEETFSEWIQSSKTLKELIFCPTVTRDVNWGSFFSCLKEKTCLESLTVPARALKDDEAYRELMEVLHVNSTLQEVNFRGGGFGSRTAAVREALRAKARQGSYLAEMRKGLGQAPRESPKCGRVFLCGSPEAGKTRLTRTMCEMAKPKSIMTRLKEKVLGRTEGVEIHTLPNDEDMQILLWDLAGQDIFRALQEFLFPRLSRAFLFIFVFSPFKKASQKSSKKELKPQLQEAFEKELLEWLRFIMSNSAVSGSNLPQLMVVISHHDLYKSLKVDLQWLNTVLDRFIIDFGALIQIHSPPYRIDGHEPKDVKPILNEVYFTFHQLFQKKLPKVPTACYHLSQHLVRWTSHNPTVPIIDDQKFFELCGDVPELRTFSEKCRDDDVHSKRLLKAVGSYLHDVGTVINMTLEEEIMEKRGNPNCNLIVVNPNWLTHAFLGRFIGFEQRFQLTPEEEEEWAERCVDGFMSETDFQTLLPKRLKPITKQFTNVTLETVQDLMENLDLLNVTTVVDQEGRLTDGSRFFIPTFFKQKSAQSLRWHQNEGGEKSGLAGEIYFLGVRLCCKDLKRTYLSPAFFSRFQVMIWRKFMEELRSNNPVIDCKFNLISILVDGFDILIESDEGGEFIDVLIGSNNSRKAVWDYVERFIVKELLDFCASSRGCPGVELVMHIIRTECVRHLTPCEHRKNQSVSKEDLNRKLMVSVEKLGPGSEENDLYSHTWKSVPEAKLGAEWQKAVDLLPPNDVQEAYALIKSKTRSLQEKVSKLNDVMEEVDKETKSLGQEISVASVETNYSAQQLVPKKFRKSPSRDMGENSNIMRGIQRLESDVRRVGEDVKEVLVEVRELKVEIREMNRLHQRQGETLTRMYRKLDQLMGQSMSTMEWPKRPYFTRKDVSVCHKITAVVNIGTPLMLHFQCEEKYGNHFVRDQPGYEITVGRENCEILRQISKTSVRVILYLLKAGLHISVGMKELVPEVETSDGNITSLTAPSIVRLLKKVPVQDPHDGISKQPTDPCSPEKAWSYLRDFLTSKLKSRITECFSLHPAKYFDSESTHAWLCQECLDAGWNGKKLKKL